MSLFQAYPNAQVPAAPSADGTAKPAFKPSATWVNIVVPLPMKGEDGEVTIQNVPLVNEFGKQLGIALEHIKPQPVPNTQNLAVKKRIQAQNMLLAILQGKSGEINPGERTIVPQFQTEVYRKAGEDTSEATSEDNEMLAALEEMFTAKTAAA